MSLGPAELLVILAIVLLLFGSTRLPKLARSLGQASREFKQGVAESPSEHHRDGTGADARTDDGARSGDRAPKTGG